MQDRHAHLLLSAARADLEREFGVSLPNFRTFDLPALQEGETETSTQAIARLNRWVRQFLVPLCQRPNYLEVSVRSALEQAQKSGVTRFEASFGADFPRIYHLTPEDCVERIARTHQEFTPTLDFRLDLGFPRTKPAEDLEKWLGDVLRVRDRRPDLAPYFGGIDLYDVEDAQPPETFRSLFRTAQNAGLKLKAHVGEFGSAETIRHTVEVLDLAEVQHGIHAMESPEVLRSLADRGTILNVSPTSNRILHAFDWDQRPTPVERLREAGVQFLFSSDDYMLFGASAADEMNQFSLNNSSPKNEQT